MRGYICGSSVGRCNSVLVCWCYGVGYVKYYEFIVRTECDLGCYIRGGGCKCCIFVGNNASLYDICALSFIRMALGKALAFAIC